MRDFIRQKMPPKFFGSFLLDLEDRARAGTFQAHRVISDNFKLNAKRSRGLEGQARFRLLEEAFEVVCGLHGGVPLVNGIIPNTDLRTFQPFHRFEFEGQGIILGLAMMATANTLPTKNLSRESGVNLNFGLEPSLFDDGAKTGDVFALFLAEKDRQVAGQLAEIAVGVIDAGYTKFLDYEPLDKYLRGHADIPVPTPLPLAPSAPSIRLKSGVGPYEPPEVSEEAKKVVGDNDE